MSKVEGSREKTGGRTKGTPNKTTSMLKNAIISAAEAAGENMNGKNGLVGYCTFLATKEPKAFSQLLGKVLPMQIAGDPDAPLQTVTRIELVPLTGNDDN